MRDVVIPSLRQAEMCVREGEEHFAAVFAALGELRRAFESAESAIPAGRLTHEIVSAMVKHVTRLSDESGTPVGQHEIGVHELLVSRCFSDARGE